MSLTSHLKSAEQSPLGHFFRQRFPHTSRLTKEINQQLRTLRPVLPPILPTQPWPYSQIGMALDYRIRYSFAPTPVHRLVAWKGAQLLLSSSDQLKLNLMMVETENVAVSLPHQRSDASGSTTFYPFEVIRAFFLLLEETVDRLQPAGHLLEEEEERQLGRLCYLLGLFEVPFRSGRFDGPLVVPAPRRTVDALLDVVQASWLDDLCALSRLFLTQQSHLLLSPHVLNPVFAGSRDVGGADADLIVDGCLIDLKTTKQASIEAEWLRQIVGYLLLDYEDSYHVQSVGLYLARYGKLCTWPTDLFVQVLTGDPGATVADLRGEFYQLVRTIRVEHIR